MILKEDLADVRMKTCAQTHWEHFKISESKKYRYLRFNALSFYGLGAGLQAISWNKGKLIQ